MTTKAEIVAQDAGNAMAPTSSTTPAHLLAIAVQQGADIDRLEKLMELQERYEANEARKAYTVAMTGFKSEHMEILKRKNVSFSGTNYNHAELSDITEAIGSALSKHDLSYRWDVHQGDGSTIVVDCILTHSMGHSERVSMTAPPDDSGRKNRIQQIASTTTYLQRYTLLAVTGMSTKGMDDDGRAADAAPVDDSWYTAIGDCATLEELNACKKDAVSQYGFADKVPANLKHAFQKRTKELQVQAA